MWERARGASSFAWLHSLVIFIEWMDASNVLVFVGRQYYWKVSFLHCPLCNFAFICYSSIASDSCWASLYAVSDSSEPRSMLSPIVGYSTIEFTWHWCYHSSQEQTALMKLRSSRLLSQWICNIVMCMDRSQKNNFELYAFLRESNFHMNMLHIPALT